VSRRARAVETTFRGSTLAGTSSAQGQTRCSAPEIGREGGSLRRASAGLQLGFLVKQLGKTDEGLCSRMTAVP
jgi:hypothetical protein